METIRVYLDVPIIGALIAWIQDATLLWMVAQISSLQSKIPRLILAGLCGAIYQFLLLVNQGSGGIVDPWILSPLIFMIIIPLLMLSITFYPFTLKKALRVTGYFFLLAFLLSGILWGIDSLNERFLHWDISWWWRFCLHLMTIFVLGELGWGVVHRKVWEQRCLYPIQISWDNQQVRLNALLDTGNRLQDPLTKVPVIIVELSQIKDQLPFEVLELVNEVQQGGFSGDWNLPAAWEGRVRLLPFNSLGREHGLLLGFRPDHFKVWQKQQEFISLNVVIGLYNRTLSREGAFQALIPPTVLNV